VLLLVVLLLLLLLLVIAVDVVSCAVDVVSCDVLLVDAVSSASVVGASVVVVVPSSVYSEPLWYRIIHISQSSHAK